MIIEATKRLIEGKNLSLIDTREVFDEILSGLADEIQTSSFLTALKAKKATSDELLGAILSSKEAISLPDFAFNNQNSIQNLCLEKTQNIPEMEQLVSTLSIDEMFEIIKKEVASGK